MIKKEIKNNPVSDIQYFLAMDEPKSPEFAISVAVFCVCANLTSRKDFPTSNFI